MTRPPTTRTTQISLLAGDKTRGNTFFGRLHNSRQHVATVHLAARRVQAHRAPCARDICAHRWGLYISCRISLVRGCEQEHDGTSRERTLRGEAVASLCAPVLKRA